MGIRFTGTPGGGATPSSMQPGNSGGGTTDPIQARIQNEAQANAAWTQMGASSGVQNILAANAARNQQASNHGAMGYNASGLGYSLGGSNRGGSNPSSQYANPQFGSAVYYLRGIFQSGQQTAANTAGILNVTHMAGGGGPGVPNFGWGSGGNGPPMPPRPGGGGPPNIPNFNQGPGGGFNPAVVPGNQNPPGPPTVPPGPRPNQPSNPTSVPFRGFGIGAAIEAAKDLYFMPQTIAGMEGSWLGKTAQARDYIDSTSIMGQSGGFNSKDFRTNLRKAGERGGDDWLLRSGLGEDEAAQMVGNLGVVPRSTEEATNMARNMANTRTTPGMSGIPTGMITGIMRDMLGIGATTPDRMGSMNNDLGAIMKQTAQTGQDQLKVLRSIDTGVVSLSTAPGAVTAISPADLFQTNQRYIGTPAGMAGVAGEQSITATQAAWSTVGSNPARTIVASEVVDKLKTEESLRNHFGGDKWDTFTSSPIGREMANSYLRDINAGHTYGAMLTFSNGLMKDPTLASSTTAQGDFINNAITNQYGDGQEGLKLGSQAALSGQSYANVTAYQMARKKGQAMGMAANNPMNLEDKGQPGVVGFVTAQDNEKVGVYRNMALGIAASVNQLRSYEKDGLMSPREIAMKWSGGHASEAYIKSVSEAIGVDSNTKVNMNDPSVASSYIRGAQPFETGPTHLSSGDINSGVDLAFGNKSANPNLRTDGSPDPNVPTYNEAVGTAKGDVLQSGSERWLRQGENLNTNVNSISDAWRPIIAAIDMLAGAIRAAAMSSAIPLNVLH